MPGIKESCGCKSLDKGGKTETEDFALSRELLKMQVIQSGRRPSAELKTKKGADPLGSVGGGRDLQQSITVDIWQCL